MSLGVVNTLQRYIPEYYQKGEYKIAHNLYRTVSFLRLMANVILLGITLVLWEEIAPIIKITEYKHHFMFFTLIIFVHMQRNLLEICLSSYYLHQYSKKIGCAFPLIKSVGYGLIILFEKNIWYAIMTDLLAYLIVFTALQILYVKKIPVYKGSMDKLSNYEKKRLIKYSMFYNFNDAGVGLLTSGFDNFIIAMFLNPIVVGAYAFCYNLKSLISSLLPLVYLIDVIRPAFFSTAASSTNQNSVFFQTIVKVNLIFSLPCFFFMLLYVKDIISLVYNGKFIAYSSVLTTMFFLAVVNNSLSLPISLIAQFQEKADIIFYSKIFAVYNLIADVILIKLFGIWGAVFATETANFGKNLFVWYFVRGDAHFKGMGIFLLKIIFFWMVIVSSAYYINIFVIHTVVKLLMGSLIFSIAFIFQFKCDYFLNNEKKNFAMISQNSPKLLFVFRKLRMLPD